MARPSGQRVGETRERIFRYVRNRLLAGVSPTVRQVQAAMRFRAVQSAHEHLQALVAEGRLRKERTAGGCRFRLAEDFGKPPVLVPLLGRVQAGAPITALEDFEGYVPMDAVHAHGELFALRVRGDSMVGVGILEDDVVIVRRQSSAQSGEIVVALMGDEATVKTLRIDAGRVELHAANPSFAPIVASGEVTVLGLVIEIRRRLKTVAATFDMPRMART